MYYIQISGKKLGPVKKSCNNFIKLSFKDGLEESFVFSFKNTLSVRKWESSPLQQANSSLPPKQVIKYYMNDSTRRI